MDYLELCQRVAREAGLAGSGPEDLSAVSGDEARIKAWVNDAWVDIQSHSPYWDFLWSEFRFQTQDGYRDYDPAQTSANVWERDSFLMYKTADGESQENFLNYVPYADWRSNFERGEPETKPPSHFTILPNNRIRLDTFPDDTYTITGTYWKKPVPLVENTDTPVVASNHHLAIVYRALLYYATYEEAADVLSLATNLYNTYFTRLCNQELPSAAIGAEPIG